MKYDLSIQIVNYKTKKYLLKCVADAIEDLKDSNVKYVINILENNSGEDLGDLADVFKNENIQIFYSDKNLGFGGGHNLLSEKNEAEFILLLNPDVEIIEKLSIERLLETAKRQDVAVVGPKLINKMGNVQVWDHGELHGLFAWISNNAGHAYWRDRNKIGEVAWVSGAVFLIKSDIFKKAGKFDENFFLYKEEEDLCISIRRLGEKVIYDPAIKFVHINSVVANKETYMPDSAKYYNKKHFKNKFALTILNALHSTIWKIKN